MLGPERAEWQVNDNGEPSGTAGRPILGRSIPADLRTFWWWWCDISEESNSGLPASSRPTARQPLRTRRGGHKEMRRKRRIRVTFGYETADRVMRVVKSPDVDVISKRFDNLCSVEIEFPPRRRTRNRREIVLSGGFLYRGIDCRYGLKRMKVKKISTALFI